MTSGPTTTTHQLSQTQSPETSKGTVMTTTFTGTAPVAQLRTGAIRPQRFTRLFQVEFRKLLDNRSGKAILGIALAAPVIALTWLLIQGTGGDESWRAYAQFTPALGLIIPLIGLFAMTSEWTQRTALSTFTLSPRRGRVLAAKFAASFTLAMAVVAVTVGLTAGATVLGGVIHGQTPSFEFFGGDVRGLVILTALQVIMAAGFGALAAQTAVAVAAFLVAPTLWAVVGNAVFGVNAQWLHVFHAYDRLSGDQPFTELPQTLTAIAVWVVLPTTIGVWRSLRREVK